MQKSSLKTILINLGFLFIVLVMLAGAIKTVADFGKLISKSYKVDADQLILIDSFSKQGRLEYIHSGKGSKKGYHFGSINGYGFRIENSTFEGVIDRSELERKLNRYELQFLVYSDRESFDKYKSTKTPFAIDVFQIRIGSKNYIDIEKGNSKFQRQLLIRSIVGLFLLIFSLFAFPKWWTERKQYIAAYARR